MSHKQPSTQDIATRSIEQYTGTTAPTPPPSLLAVEQFAGTVIGSSR